MTPTELFALVRRHGAVAPWDAMAVAAALVESSGDPNAVGDNGHSFGLWQMYDAGLGADMTPEERCDPEVAAATMLPHFQVWYESGVSLGYHDEELVRYVCLYTERPWGFPDLYCNAADRYLAAWKSLDVAPEPEMEQLVREGSVEEQLRAEREWGTALLVEVKKWAALTQEHLDALQAIVNTMKENAG